MCSQIFDSMFLNSKNLYCSRSLSILVGLAVAIVSFCAFSNKIGVNLSILSRLLPLYTEATPCAREAQIEADNI